MVAAGARVIVYDLEGNPVHTLKGHTVRPQVLSTMHVDALSIPFPHSLRQQMCSSANVHAACRMRCTA